MCGQYLCVWVFHRVRTSLRVQSTDSLLACQWHYIITAKRLLGNDEECLSLLAPADRERVRQKIRDECTSFRSFCLVSMMWVNTLSFRFWMKKGSLNHLQKFVFLSSPLVPLIDNPSPQDPSVFFQMGQVRRCRWAWHQRGTTIPPRSTHWAHGFGICF